MVHQHLDNPSMTCKGGKVKRGASDTLGVHRRTLRDQASHDCGVPGKTSDVQRCPVVVIAALEVSTSLQEQFRNSLVPFPTSEVEGPLTRLVPSVQVGP